MMNRSLPATIEELQSEQAVFDVPWFCSSVLGELHRQAAGDGKLRDCVSLIWRSKTSLLSLLVLLCAVGYTDKALAVALAALVMIIIIITVLVVVFASSPLSRDAKRQNGNLSCSELLSRLHLSQASERQRECLIAALRRLEIALVDGSNPGMYIIPSLLPMATDKEFVQCWLPYRTKGVLCCRRFEVDDSAVDMFTAGFFPRLQIRLANGLGCSGPALQIFKNAAIFTFDSGRFDCCITLSPFLTSSLAHSALLPFFSLFHVAVLMSPLFVSTPPSLPHFSLFFPVAGFDILVGSETGDSMGDTMAAMVDKMLEVCKIAQELQMESCPGIRTTCKVVSVADVKKSITPLTKPPQAWAVKEIWGFTDFLPKVRCCCTCVCVCVCVCVCSGVCVGRRRVVSPCCVLLKH
jgi:hypothetical protein